jgi:hypothetical protein
MGGADGKKEKLSADGNLRRPTEFSEILFRVCS